MEPRRRSRRAALLRRAGRELVSWGVVCSAVAAVAGFAWLTRHPEAPIVATAAEWPVVGVAARLFQSRWLPPPGSVVVPADPGGGSTLTRVVIPIREVVVEDFFDLPERPEDPMAIPWSHDREPWTGTGAPPLGNDPVPVLPLPGRPADPTWLEAARSFFTVAPEPARLGSYSLLTDVDDGDLLARLAEVTAEVEPLYVARYGVEPVGDPAETIVLYRSEESYRRLQARSEHIRGLVFIRGHVGYGLIALYAGEGSHRAAVVSVLRHELAHLLNRRSLGPALPTWLDEGLADDFAAFELAPSSAPRFGEQQADDTPHPEPAASAAAPSRTAKDTSHDASISATLQPRESPLDAMRRVEGSRVEIWGTLASLDRLARAHAAGSTPPLEALLELDWKVFVEEPSADLHYAASAWLVRYLLDSGSGLDLAFRSFLGRVARGGGAGARDLETSLGRPLAEIESGWRHYVRERAAAAGVGAAPAV